MWWRCGGNVDTRLRRLAQGEFDAIVLARAGLQRLGREAEIGAVLDPERFVPAPGQGALALQARADDERLPGGGRGDRRRRHLRLPAGRARRRARARRQLPHAARARTPTPAGCGCLQLRAWVGLPDGSAWIADELLGGFYEPEELGRAVAERMRAAGPRAAAPRGGDGGRCQRLSRAPGGSISSAPGPAIPGC